MIAARDRAPDRARLELGEETLELCAGILRRSPGPLFLTELERRLAACGGLAFGLPELCRALEGDHRFTLSEAERDAYDRTVTRAPAAGGHGRPRSAR